MMQRRFVLAVCCAIVLLVGGCSQSKKGGSSKASKPSAKSQSPAGTVDREAEAREKLTSVLDAWTLGDTVEKWCEEHPNVDLFDVKRKFDSKGPFKLLKYEIGAARGGTNDKDASAFEITFAVVLNLTDNTGAESRANANYVVSRMPDGKWMVVTNW